MTLLKTFTQILRSKIPVSCRQVMLVPGVMVEAAGHGFAKMMPFSPLSFLQDILPILWTRGPGQMVTVT